jgi:hypothetical protein
MVTKRCCGGQSRAALGAAEEQTGGRFGGGGVFVGVGGSGVSVAVGGGGVFVGGSGVFVAVGGGGVFVAVGVAVSVGVGMTEICARATSVPFTIGKILVARIKTNTMAAAQSRNRPLCRSFTLSS